MSRNNEERFQQPPTEPSNNTLTEAPKPFNFVTPQEYVDLPSKGKYYPEGHPLCGVDSVPIYYMTAKEEDILTSESLFKKGLVFDKLIESVLVNKLPSRSLLDSDRSAILIAARRTGFGDDYHTSCGCPKCGNIVDVEANLETDVFTEPPKTSIHRDLCRDTADNTFIYRIEDLNAEIELRLLTGQDDSTLHKETERRKKKKLGEALYTNRLHQMLVSINGDTDPFTLKYFSEKVPLIYSKEIFEAYKAVAPTIEIRTEYDCAFCNSNGSLEVPMTKDFFWPDA